MGTARRKTKRTHSTHSNSPLLRFVGAYKPSFVINTMVHRLDLWNGIKKGGIGRQGNHAYFIRCIYDRILFFIARSSVATPFNEIYAIFSFFTQLILLWHAGTHTHTGPKYVYKCKREGKKANTRITKHIAGAK